MNIDQPTFGVVYGYEEYRKAINGLECNGFQTAVFFIGQSSDGSIWCDYTARALPLVEYALLTHKSIYCCAKKAVLFVGVGLECQWNRPDNPFKCDPELQLTELPTLRYRGTCRGLSRYECVHYPIINGFFCHFFQTSQN